jgi:hypothetical protein
MPEGLGVHHGATMATKVMDANASILPEKLTIKDS